MRYPFTPQANQTQAAIGIVKKTASQELAQELANHQTISVERKGNAITVEIAKPPRGHAALRISQRANGDIRHYEYGTETPGGLYPQKDLHDTLKRWAIHQLTRHLARHMEEPLLLNILADLNEHELVDTIHERAAHAVSTQLKPARIQPRHIPINTVPHAVDQANRIIHEEMIDHRVTRLAATILSPTHTPPALSANPPSSTYPKIDTHTYNAFRINRDTFNSLLQEGYIHTLRLYVTHIAPPRARNKRIPHPGIVVSALRESLQLTPAQWKAFIQVDSGQYIEQEDPVRYIRERTAFIADLNRPDLTQHQVNQIFRYPGLLEFTHTPWQRGNPHEALKQIFRAYLAYAIPEPQEPGEHDPNYGLRNDEPREPTQFARDIPYVADALRAHVEAEEPWGPGNWEQLVRRAQRWHARHGRRYRLHPITDAMRTTAWESLLDEQDTKQICEAVFPEQNARIQHLGSGNDLIRAAQRMDNCLDNFATQCSQGHSRIFTIMLENEILAATQLIRERNRWLQGQIEAPQRQDIDPRSIKAAQLIRERYNQRQNQAKT